jgi:N-acetylneuraminic acid mutarotase
MLYGRSPGEQPGAPAAAATEAPRWQSRAQLAEPRAGLALAVYENRIYALGGEAAGGVTGSVERYDPQKDAWEPRQTKPVPAADITAGVIGGKIYVPGGRLEDGSSSNVLEIYDPATDSWSLGAVMPAPRSAYALTVFEGKLYIFGGWDGKEDTSTTFRYDPELNEWEILEPMPTARSFSGAAVSDGKVYVLGGRSGEKSLAVNEIYWPAREGTNEPRWTSAAALPAGRFAMGVASIVDILYLVGGETQQEGGGITLAFVPAQNEWQEFPEPQVLTWSRMGVALLGSELYVLGGLINQQPSGQNLAYKAIYTVSIPTIIKDQ